MKQKNDPLRLNVYSVQPKFPGGLRQRNTNACSLTSVVEVKHAQLLSVAIFSSFVNCSKPF